MDNQSEKQLSAEMASMFAVVVEANQLDPVSFNHIWSNEVSLKGVNGFVAIALQDSGCYYAMANMPIIVMPVNGVILAFPEILQLLTCIGDIPSSQFFLSDNTLYCMLCLALDSYDPQQIPNTLEELLELVKAIRVDLLRAINEFYPGSENEHSASKRPDVKLPNIKMTPADARVIYGILMQCSPTTQDLYRYIMEQWEKAGFLVETTEQSIVLDIPYGLKTARLAVILPGIRERTLRIFPVTTPHPPAIVLIWERLRRHSGFNEQSISEYQQTVSKSNQLHLTESSASISINPAFDRKKARELLKAMAKLARSVIAEQIEPDVHSVPVTPANIQETLALCDDQTRSIFEVLYHGWEQSGGTIQCKSPGRIYLRLKTQAHRVGNISRIPHNFNLVVLVAPKAKKSAQIQVTWDLGGDSLWAYLDCIPFEVAQFEQIVQELPGFQVKGTITGLVIGPDFKDEHAQILLKTMLMVKEAEENTE